MTQLPISLVIVTLNEEKNIKRCIMSAPFCDDVVIVDSFSTDKTKEISESCGARVFQESWRGFGPQKDFAAQLAKNDWILSLDADEALSPELQAEIIQKINQQELDPHFAYEFPRRSFHLGRWICFGGWHPDYQRRLFHRRHHGWSLAQIHEKIEAKQIKRFKADLLHWVFDNLSAQVKTNDRYSGLQAKALLDQGKKFSLWNLLTKPPTKFIECYFWKRGFLDGLAGFIIAVGAAYSVFLKWAKLWELHFSKIREQESGERP